MNVSRSKYGRSAVSLALILCVALMWATVASAAPPRFFSNMKSATWTAHLTNADGDQGELWLRKTPCGLGSFIQLKAPSVDGLATEERLVLRGDGGGEQLLAVVPASLPDFGIAIAYWPTGTPMFPDEPSDLFVQLAPNAAFGAAHAYPYEPADAAWMTPDDYFSALDSGNVWVEVVVDGDVIMSGRVYR